MLICLPFLGEGRHRLCRPGAVPGLSPSPHYTLEWNSNSRASCLFRGTVSLSVGSTASPFCLEWLRNEKKTRNPGPSWIWVNTEKNPHLLTHLWDSSQIWALWGGLGRAGTGPLGSGHTDRHLCSPGDQLGTPGPGRQLWRHSRNVGFAGLGFSPYFLY